MNARVKTVDIPVEIDLDDFDNEEIRAEYESRFGVSDDMPDGFDEILDLIAEAARTSRHAVKAYELLYQKYPDARSLKARQTLIAGRMKDVA